MVIKNNSVLLRLCSYILFAFLLPSSGSTADPNRNDTIWGEFGTNGLRCGITFVRMIETGNPSFEVSIQSAATNLIKLNVPETRRLFHIALLNSKGRPQQKTSKGLDQGQALATRVPFASREHDWKTVEPGIPKWIGTFNLDDFFNIKHAGTYEL